MCTDATHLQTCNGGVPSTTTCSGSCLTTALGGQCTTALATSPLTLKIQYSARGPNANFTDWNSTTVDIAVPELLVFSFRGNTVVDVQTTDGDGAVTLRVPSALQADDRIVLLPAASDGAGGLAFLVADPGFSTPGTYQQGTVGTPKFWVWGASTTGLTNGMTLTVTEELGSGALRVFDYLRYVYSGTRALAGGQRGKSLVVWLGFGTEWNCGACFGALPTFVSKLPFASQMWLNGSLTNQGYWSDAVTAHELGHWVMASYGRPPGEGGRHILSVPTYPGIAWSEGFATWLSSVARTSTTYYDKQGGSFFWIDIGGNRYSDATWHAPVPGGGLLQLMDENEVAAILWDISQQTGVEPLLAALASPQMKSSPWPRGYTRHQWTSLDSSGVPTNVVDTGSPAPALPDFLDALRCSGTSAAIVDAATSPTTRYPYPSSAPLCP